MNHAACAGPVLEMAVALAARRGWDHDILSPDRLVLTLPSRRHRFRYGGVVDSAAGMWRVRLFCDLSLSDARQEATRATMGLMNGNSPMAFTLSPDGELAVSFEESFGATPPSSAARLERRIDAAVSDLDLCRQAVLLVNWGGQSPPEALASVLETADRPR